MLKTSDDRRISYGYDSSCTFYLGAVIVTLVCQAFAGVVSAALEKSVPDIASNPDFNTAFMIFIQLCNLGFILLFTKLRGYKSNFTLVNDSVSGKPITPLLVVLPIIGAVVFMAAVYLPTVWYGYFTVAIGIPEDAGAIELTTVSSTVMLVVASVFLAPVFEETIYRGVLLNGLKTELSAGKAILMSALAFMLMHMSPLQVVVQFALGAVSGYLMIRSRRLLPSVLLHASANATALVIQLTDFGGVLASCVQWLTHNIAAAVFITLGLFVVGGAVLVAGIDLACGGDLVKKIFIYRSGAGEPVKEASEPAEAESVNSEKESAEAPEHIKSTATRLAKKKSGTFKYWLGIAICGLMFVLNMVTFIIS